MSNRIADKGALQDYKQSMAARSKNAAGARRNRDLGSSSSSLRPRWQYSLKDKLWRNVETGETRTDAPTKEEIWCRE